MALPSRLLPLLSLSILLVSCDFLTPEDKDEKDNSTPATVYNKFVQMHFGSEYSSYPSQHDMAFLDSEHGMTVGGSGSRFITEDGGESWTLTQTGNDEYFERIFPIDSKTFVIGTRKPELFYVEDGNWEQIALPIAEGTYLWDFKRRYDTLWYVTTGHFTTGESSHLLKSDDGGTSWDTLQTSRSLLRGVEILDDGTLLLTINAVTGTGIWFSNDSGETWDGTGPGNLGSEYQGYCRITKLASLDNDHLIAVCAAFGDDEGALCTSSDGGASWEYALCDNRLENIAVRDSEVYICGAMNFVARWKFDFNHFSAAEIIADWHVWNPDTDFLYYNGKVITQKKNFMQIRAVSSKRIFAFDPSEVFRLELE